MINKFRILFFLIVFAFSAIGAKVSEAQRFEEYVVDFNRASTFALPVEQHMGYNHAEYFSKSFDAPTEPPFKKIKFLKQDEPRFIQEQVERLLHGVTIDIPPEYDYYGYEIRRYMRSILTPNELQDSLKLRESVNNAKRARIIMNYWQRHLNREIVRLNEEMETGDVPSRIRSTFRYNEGRVINFIPEIYSWIDRNIDFLEFLQENQGQYFVRYPLYQIPDFELRKEFKRLYDARENARKRVIKYSPFRMMIY